MKHGLKSSYSSGSFSNLRSLVNGSVSGDCILLSGVYFSDGKSIRIYTDDISIKGSSINSRPVIVGGAMSSPVFAVYGNNVIFENIIFRNFDADVWGLMRVYGKNLTLRNCDFINASSKSGALFLEDTSDNAIIENCLFENNSAFYPSSSGGKNGGAIDSHANNTKIINCTSSTTLQVMEEQSTSIETQIVP